MKEWLIPREPKEFIPIQFGSVITSRAIHHPLVVLDPTNKPGSEVLVNIIHNIGKPSEFIEFGRSGSIPEKSIDQVVDFLDYARMQQAWRKGLEQLVDEGSISTFMDRLQTYAEEVRYTGRIIKSGSFR